MFSQRNFSKTAQDTQGLNFLEKQIKKEPIIISVGGGKGGVGKSFLTSNIATRIALLGHKVAVVDLDLGTANLHTCLGVSLSQLNISNFLNGSVKSLSSLGIKSYIPNLVLFSGGQEFWQRVQLDAETKIKLMNSLQEMDFEYIFLDLGAGTHVHNLDFFIFSDVGLIIVTPEPTSIENSYVFMKGLLYRKIQNICRALSISEKIELQLLEKMTNLEGQTPFQKIENFILENSEISHEIIELIHSTNVGVLVNQARTNEDKELGESMSLICNRYFGFSSQFLGSMRYDDSVWKSIRIGKPLVIEHPNMVSSTNIYVIADEMMKRFEPLRNKENQK